MIADITSVLPRLYLYLHSGRSRLPWRKLVRDTVRLGMLATVTPSQRPKTRCTVCCTVSETPFPARECRSDRCCPLGLGIDQHARIGRPPDLGAVVRLREFHDFETLVRQNHHWMVQTRRIDANLVVAGVRTFFSDAGRRGSTLIDGPLDRNCEISPPPLHCHTVTVNDR